MTAFLLISTGILLLIAVPIGMAMGTASLLTILQGGTLNALIITQKLLSGVSKFSLLAIPMFTLAGEVMTLGGVSDKLIYLANRVVGRFKGGLSMVTTLACMFFGAISGSATATAAAIGGIMVEPMEKAGYKKEYTAAVIASSGLLGLIIPPSGITNSPAVVLLLVNLALFVAGALLDNVAAITLLTPVLVPLISAYGIDKTFFGIIMIINLSIGQITPPIGMNLFVSSSICEVRLEKVIRQVLPFLAVLIVDLFLFTYIPGIVTVLPNALLH